MKTINLHYAEVDSDEGFRKFAVETEGKINGNTILFTKGIEKGKLVKLTIENEVSLKAWSFSSVSRDIDFDKEPYNSIDEKVFTLFILLGANQIVLRSPRIKKDIIIAGRENIPLLSNNTFFTIHVLPGQEFKAIEISISSEWLKTQLHDSKPAVLNFVNEITQNDEPVIFLGTCSPEILTNLNDLHQQVTEATKGLLYFRSKTLQLVSDFFESSIASKELATNDTHPLHHQQIIRAAGLLTASLDKTLPPLGFIAKEVAMSESTLRRHFKLVFGQNIYSYYLQKKMDHAKRMLLNESTTVNEVAAKLGYEKVSNFISSFKKFHGYSPGSMRKK
jgi:AraC-like DNA-binding protein